MPALYCQVILQEYQEAETWVSPLTINDLKKKKKKNLGVWDVFDYAYSKQ